MRFLYYFVGCFLAFQCCKFGQCKNSRLSRIVQGDKVMPGEIKYTIVTLHDDTYYACGGGIINNYYVLSAAHCFIDNQDKFNDKNIKVIAGVVDYNNVNDPRRVEVEVKKMFVPDGYKDKDFVNDIALLNLKGSLDIEKNDLQILSLPSRARNLTNLMALVAGFGYDEHRTFNRSSTGEIVEEGSTSGILRKANVSIFDNAECQRLYKNDKIYDSNLCGKMVKKSEKEYGLCDGDSGSPLVFNSTEIIGVASWSYGCDERNKPLVYTKVESFLDFIDNAMKNTTEGMRVKVFA